MILAWEISGEYESYLDLFFQLTFEARPDNFSLAWLEAICNGRDGAYVISHREEDQLLVDEIRIRDLVRVVIEISARLHKS